jgi:hypothetical protein
MISNRSELYAAVAEWLNREDLTDQIPQFVRLAEEDIYRDLQTPDNEFTATYTQTEWYISGQTAAAAEVDLFRSLPSNFSSLRSVTWNGVPLDPISDYHLKLRLVNETDVTPQYFCVINRKIVFSADILSDPAEWEDDDVLEVNYYGVESLDSFPTWQVATNPVENPAVEDTSPENLTQGDSNTTRMLQRNPGLYLHGAQYYGSLFLRDAEGAGLYGTLFRGKLTELKTAAKATRYAGGTKSVNSAY